MSNTHKSTSPPSTDRHANKNSPKISRIDPQITLNDLKNFRVAYTNEPVSREPVNCLDFSADGHSVLFNTRHLITITKLDQNEPKNFTITVKKYGSGICKFFHQNKIIHTSTDVNHSMRLLDAESKQYAMYLDGHTEDVTFVEVFGGTARADFASASRDKTVKIWDAREPKFVKSKSFKDNPLIAVNPVSQNELVVAYKSEKSSYVVTTFDIRKLEGRERIGNFYTAEQILKWTNLKFSDNRKYLMVNTSGSLSLVFNPQSGDILHKLVGYKNKSSASIETCFTPDSNFILGGSDEGEINIWDLKTSVKERILTKPVRGATSRIMFNPVLMCIATAGDKFHLWIEKEL